MICKWKQLHVLNIKAKNVDSSYGSYDSYMHLRKYHIITFALLLSKACLNIPLSTTKVEHELKVVWKKKRRENGKHENEREWQRYRDTDEDWDGKRERKKKLLMAKDCKFYWDICVIAATDFNVTLMFFYKYHCTWLLFVCVCVRWMKLHERCSHTWWLEHRKTYRQPNDSTNNNNNQNQHEERWKYVLSSASVDVYVCPKNPFICLLHSNIWLYCFLLKTNVRHSNICVVLLCFVVFCLCCWFCSHKKMA